MDSISIPNPYVGLLLLGGLLAGSVSLVKSRENKYTFPGPTQFPLIGRVHDLPRTSAWLKFKEWADKYGPIYQTSMMGQKFVIVSDEEIAKELLHKKADQLSGRAQIRALLDHKDDPTYFALQDRQGMAQLKFRNEVILGEPLTDKTCPRNMADAEEMGPCSTDCLISAALSWPH